ncbi:uncharacterized protein BHQ10_006679 [Talaromyces amestolkiae]|uniref:DNA endonuclease activator Ctp1 C-terminal domain-containing protein n=1 Tax=Talaromyces amestolkiae TaxID=1196081 RepID=A0A364L4D1_TALAM|nr:uncharacterized protein BHQ10_006679 [Talaromyces amestolkiae]RAO70667.1 hypothetical protein BHQ10_006679 [Talaromyces amestolkiae]
MDSVVHHLDLISKDLEAARNEAAKQAVKYQEDTDKLNKNIRSLEYQRKTDQQRIKKLQSDIADLQRYKKATNPGAHEDVVVEEEDDGSDDRMIETKLQKLKEKYDPEKATAISWPEGRLSVQLVSSIQRLKNSYNDIYKETAALVKIISSLRAQVKHHKRRAEQWQRWCAESSAKDKAPTDTNLDTIGPSIEQCVHQQNNTLSTPKSVRTQDEGQYIPSSSAVASTASNSSPIPPISSNEARGNRPDYDSGDQSRITRVKDEPLSPGSLEGPSLGEEIFPVASEDLDEVGDTVTTPRSRRFAVFEDGVSRLQHDGPITTPNFQGERRAFQPKDTNQINQFRTPQESAFKRRKTCDSGASAISTVAEDGEDQNYIPSAIKVATDENDTPSKGPVRPSDAHRRLDDLLAARPHRQSPALDRPRTRILVQSTTPVSRPGNQPASVSANQTPWSNGPTKAITGYMKTAEKRPVAKRKFQYETNPTTKTNNDEDWEAIVKSRPFRDLPVDCLDLSHFKLNPARNQGLDYAFKEVVRGESRKCLPGCMRTDCCGEKFRAMVRATGIKYDSEKHRALLEEHLGDKKSALQQLSEQALNGLLIEAKARQLANQFGKHRHAYERARSPPGFWRTDMPTTQELAKDRMEADRMDREKIYERVSEARRPDGLWKFADEID